MKLFKCRACGQVLYFENTVCERCERRLGYRVDAGTLSALDPDGEQWIVHGQPAASYRFCANWELRACNWLLAADAAESYCAACRHNRTIPDIADGDHLRQWQKIEQAKRRLFYSLLRLRLPTPAPADGDAEPLVFDFLADPPAGAGPRVMTGHDNGVITLSLREADDAEREAVRAAMKEPYRTLLGHFRHESGHFYWDRLIRDQGRLEAFRAIFGDERADYAEALRRHHEQGAPEQWQQSFVSAYASTHPWEDWAETWSHYLHILDTLEMASAFGIRIAPEVTENPDFEAELDFDPHRTRDFNALIEAWLPLTYAVNSLNRSMGQPDLYPFVLSEPAIKKLSYIHGVVRDLR